MPPGSAPNAHRIVVDAAGSRYTPQPQPNAVIPPLLIKLWRETGRNRHTWWQTHPALWQDRVYPAPPNWPDWQDPYPIIESLRKPAAEERVEELVRKPRPGTARAKEILKEREASAQREREREKENLALKEFAAPKRDPPLRDFQEAKLMAEMRCDLLAVAKKQAELQAEQAKKAAADVVEEDGVDDDFVAKMDEVRVTVREVVNESTGTGSAKTKGVDKSAKP
jgi:hypothetical protein